MQNFLNLAGTKPGYQELAGAIINAVESKLLEPGMPLPTTRALSQVLGLSRDTVIRAYNHLQSLGWVRTHSTRGTFIANIQRHQEPEIDCRPVSAERLSAYGRTIDLRGGSQICSEDPVDNGAVPRDCLPIMRWKKGIQNNRDLYASLPYSCSNNSSGQIRFRQAISSFLNRDREILAAPEDIAIFPAPFNAISAIFGLLLEAGDLIAVEDPGSGWVKEVADFLDLSTVHVPIDREGLCVDHLLNAGKKIKLVHVTANHQRPSGNTMSLARRNQLLAWAKENQAIIVEEDFDAFFHYGILPPPPLKMLDRADNVIYLGSFSQLLDQISAVCFTVLPQSFRSVVRHAKCFTASPADNLAQIVLAEMLDDGFLQRHIESLEKQFGERRRGLIYELKLRFGPNVVVAAHTGGLSMMLQFPGQPDQSLVKAATCAGLPLRLSQAFYRDSSLRKQGECLVGFAGLEPAKICEQVRTFADALAACEYSFQPIIFDDYSCPVGGDQQGRPTSSPEAAISAQDCSKITSTEPVWLQGSCS